jgi:hypothetical protein
MKFQNVYNLAETGGFEPPRPFRGFLLSKQAVLSTHPCLHDNIYNTR